MRKSIEFLMEAKHLRSIRYAVAFFEFKPDLMCRVGLDNTATDRLGQSTKNPGNNHVVATRPTPKRRISRERSR